MIPSGYKTSKVYSVKPTDGTGDLTFTRSNDTATRVASNGLIEKVRTNLLVQSNTFNTTWAPTTAITVTSGQSGYDGTSNAWLLKRSDASARYIFQNITQAASTYTFSVYAKAETVNWLWLYSSDGTNLVTAYFDLATGALGTTSGVITSKIESVGNGWYRCSISYSDDITSVRIYPAAANGSITGGISPAGIFIQNAMLEVGDVATDYIATTTAAVSVGPVANVPRLDYLNSSCPRLLLEPQRTNLVTYSEQIDNAAWAKTAAGTGVTPVVTANSAISPDGYQNADTIVFNVGAGTTSSDQSYVNQTLSVTSGSNYAFSVYLKGSVGGEQLIIRSASGSYTLLTLSNEWQRFSVTAAAASTGYAAHFGLRQGVAGTLNSTATVYAYGAQVELGAYATSYIPTLGAAVTRGADAASKTGITSLIGQTEGTIFLDFELQTTNQDMVIMNIYDAATPANGIYFYVNGSNQLQAYSDNSGTQSAILSGVLTQGRYKAAFAYKANDFSFYLNGSLVGVDTSGTVPTCNALRLENYAATPTYQEKIPVNQALLFTTRLTNAQLAELTTI